MKRNSIEIIQYIDALDNVRETKGVPYMSESDVVKSIAYVYLTKRQILRVLLYSLGLVKKL